MLRQRFYNQIFINSLPRLFISGILLFTILLAGCGSGGIGVRWGKKPPPGSSDRPVEDESYGVFPTALHIPPGHLPPPGLCRIWYPNLPPGHQPPPGNCAELAGQVPPGAWLLSRPRKKKKHIHVSVYDQTRPNVVILIRVFDSGSGRFIRDELNRKK